VTATDLAAAAIAAVVVAVVTRLISRITDRASGRHLASSVGGDTAPAADEATFIQDSSDAREGASA
jgi:hypothetical protein